MGFNCGSHTILAMRTRVLVAAIAAMIALPIAWQHARRQASHGDLTRHRQRHRHHRRRQPAHPQSRIDRHQRQRHRRHRHAGEHCRALQGGRHHRRDRQGRDARPDQHAHARGDGDVSRARQRPRADGLAAEVHLPGGSEDGVAGVRAHRHAPRAARDDPVGHDDSMRTCITSRRRWRASPRRRACAASSDRR